MLDVNMNSVFAVLIFRVKGASKQVLHGKIITDQTQASFHFVVVTIHGSGDVVTLDQLLLFGRHFRLALKNILVQSFENVRELGFFAGNIHRNKGDFYACPTLCRSKGVLDILNTGFVFVEQSTQMLTFFGKGIADGFSVEDAAN